MIRKCFVHIHNYGSKIKKIEKSCVRELVCVYISTLTRPRRNKIQVHDNVIPLNRVVIEAKRFLSLYRKTKGNPTRKPRPAVVIPDQDGFKTNFDGGYVP